MAAPIFTDFNLPAKDNEQIYDTIRLAVTLGFERIAISTSNVDLKSQRSKKSKEKIIIPPPSEVLLKEKSIQSLELNGRRFEQVSRITAVLEDATNTHRLSSPEVQAYDIIAVQPTDEKTFQLACSTLEVDIITLNFSENVRFPFKRPLVNLAIERGIHFEILYSPALQDKSVKRYTISNALQFTNLCKGKNIIISSGADQSIHLRSPHDVMNLARLFGLNAVQAKDSITKNCRSVLLHAASRKSVKSVVSVTSVSMLTKKEEWLLKLQNGTSDNSDEDDDDDDDDDDSDSNEGENDDKDDGSNDDEPMNKKIKL